MANVLRNDLAEHALLASVFTNPDSLNAVSEILSSDDFFEPRNEIIYGTILKLYETGKDYSPVSVVGDLTREGLLVKAGDISYLREIINPNHMAHIGSDPVGFALLIKEASRKRELSRAADIIKQAAEGAEGLDASDALDIANNAVVDILNKESASGSVISLLDLMPEVIRDIEEASKLPVGATPGIPSGFQLLDDMTGGFKGGQVIIIAARPAVGKSTLAVDFGRAAVFLAGKTVLMFSLEMGAKEVVSRIISAEAGVKTQDLKKGTLTELDWMQVEEAKKRFQTGTFLIDADPKMSVARIKSVANRQKLKPEGLDMVIIDYLQLMESSGNIGRNSSREQVVSEMSRGLKLLAKDLDVPVIVLSQLNRKSEERQDTRPLVSDLRESGSLEQDADIVFLIHRPEVSDPNNRPGEADLIIGKHRGGPTGKIPLTSMLEYSKFFPGEGRIPREMELSGDSEGGYGTTVDEIPW